MRLHIHRWGSGPKVVLVHGGILGGRETWRQQRELTARWTLLAPDRPGHGGTEFARQDFATEAPMIADQLLNEPAHLVGFSYGALVAWLAAALRPAMVASLTVIEPPATRMAVDVACVAAYGRRIRALYEDLPDDPREALRRFYQVTGVRLRVPDPLPDPLRSGVALLRGARPPDEAELPLAAVRQAPFETLVVSGGHLAANEVICDTLADAVGARRAVCTGAGHLIPDCGRPFNELLETFLSGATTKRHSKDEK